MDAPLAAGAVGLVADDLVAHVGAALAA